MARRRMIDPNFWTSEDMSRLTARQRLLFIGIFSNADDAGRIRGKAAYIRSTIFPYDDIELSEIENDLQGIEVVGSIVRYEVDGGSYIQVNNWKKFQTIDRPQPSILPPQDSPTNRRAGSEPIGDPVTSDSLLREYNIKEVKGKEGAIDERIEHVERLIVFEKEEQEDEFEKIWEKYPNRDGKKAALRHFVATVKTDKDVERINTALNRYLEHLERENKWNFIKAGSTWFNNWQDWENYQPSPKSVQLKGNAVVDAARSVLSKRMQEGRYEEVV